ncbi:MAG: uroporphyrinogen-III synthase [Rickettsiella sp.]|nr:uroporphyrinogen-III synthase [Rickettsiella sp.]
MKSLENLNILITRPKHQTQTLASKIQIEGGNPVSFPTLEIIALNKENILKQVRKIADYNFVIFISPNAVFKIVNYIHKIYQIWPNQTKTIAIGPGTVKALKQHNLPIDYYPEKNFSSEGVLSLLPLQNPGQKNILIVKGQGGSLTLPQTLKKRGAQIALLKVYKRSLPIHTITPEVKTIDIIICTSNAGLTNLLSLLHPVWGDALFGKQLLVISSRIADYAKKLGFVKPLLISDNASDESILQTLRTYTKLKVKSGH